MDELKKEVLSPPARDGGVICRVVSDGSRAWVESWGGPERGWETGSADLSTALKADPLSPSARPEPGIPEGFLTQKLAEHLLRSLHSGRIWA